MRRPADDRRGPGDHRRASMRAASASPDGILSELVSILVYPTTYLVPGGQSTPDGLVARARRLGSENHGRATCGAGLGQCAFRCRRHPRRTQRRAARVCASTGSGERHGRRCTGSSRRSMYVAWARVLGHDFDHWCATPPTTTALLLIATARPIRPSSSLSQPRLSSRNRASFGPNTRTVSPASAVLQPGSGCTGSR